MNSLAVFSSRARILLCAGIVFLGGPGRAHAREVSTLEDAIRLKGFSAQLQAEADADKERLSGIREVFSEKEAWEKQKRAAYEEYETEKRRQAQVVVDNGPEYHTYLNEKLASLKLEESFRQAYVAQRNERRQIERTEINLPEATELGLNDTDPRVDWKLRKFAEASHSAGSSSSPSYSSPAAAPAWEAPPPPPPPPIYEQPYYEEMMPPPPPPPLFEEENPF